MSQSIDLDTIELSNLNRQFLFHKQHIGRPKAIVARESVLKFNPKAGIIAHHDSITNNKYDVKYFRQFTAVANALDNIAARSHVNRMCLAADVPLIESGSAGYLGQVTVYKKKVTECFECLTRKPPKTYPGCTIRNTPSQPVHCIVWAKHLFNQLFGETDADEEVSPDMADPEMGSQANPAGNINRISTREWAKASNYDPKKLFKKLFYEDIEYLNQMTDLWKERQRPVVLEFDKLPDEAPGTSKIVPYVRDHLLWSVKQCGDIFCNSISDLKKKVELEGPNAVLTWDKDDEKCLDFVVSCSNLRAHCFHIPMQTKFDVKAIAGNIIPAIATTNAVVSGLLVLQLINVLKGDLTKCRTAWLNESAGAGKKIISSAQLEKPNPNCFVCSPNTPEVTVVVNPNTLTLKTLNDKVLKEKLLMVQPDAVINDGTGKILISSDPEDLLDEKMMDRVLADFGITGDKNLICEDFFQQYKVVLCLQSSNILKDQEFEIPSDINDLLQKQKEDLVDGQSQTEKEDFCETLSDAEDIQVSKEVSTDNQVSKEVSTDNQVSKEVSTDNQVSEEVPQITKYNQMSEEVPADNQMSEEVSTDNQMSEEVSTDNQMSEEVSTDNQMSEEVSADNEMSEAVTTDNQVSKEVTTDNQVSKEATPDTTTKKKNLEEENGILPPAKKARTNTE
ncbi:SUMO-activating enzyme subunit 2 [Trichonephila clavata]|uniref:SUMO-activating enzyme subunit n=1 Tax=Trichonephila clavata TaxID=2740835 RepID=A0A8X6FC23_TRICU|nr:SUMO-activating enzyme subunit 2 [Trichonephila clavata]